jgi:hypothetical protein
MVDKSVFDCIDMNKQSFSRFDVENLLRNQLIKFLSDKKWKYILMKISPSISEENEDKFLDTIK